MTARAVGGLCILAASGVLASAAYHQFDPFAQGRQRSSAARLQAQWRSRSAAPAPADGAPFAFLRIPRLGVSWRFTVSEGTTPEVLAVGPGHFKGTALPGGLGNFAVAGHTIGGGDPFQRLSTMRPGDAILVDAKDRTITYRVTAAPTVIPVTDVGITDPVPNRPGAAPTTSLITLVSCLWPFPDDAKRLVVIGTLQQ
jgi:sortase A